MTVAEGRFTVLYRYAQILAIVFCVFHILSLPVGITYDGHIYIDLADVLWSSRFPVDWHRARTPLFPLSLKLSFWAFGQQPLAAILVNSLAATLGILVTAQWVKGLAGELAGAVIAVLLSIYPTLVAYGHLVLTEAGVFLFLTCFIAVSLTGAGWRKTAMLVLLLILGYYWRPNLLITAPLFALIHTAGYRRRRIQVLCQAALIVLLPYLAAKPWRSYMDDRSMLDRMLRYGIIKQALPPPEDALVGKNPALYRSSIEVSKFQGRLYSGIRGDLCDRLASEVFVWPPLDQTSRLFAHLVATYPNRYLHGVARTSLLFSGATALVNENAIYREQILSPVNPDSKIGDGPPAVDARNRERFSQRTTSSAVLRFLHPLGPIYDDLLPAAFAVSFLGAVAAVVWRDRKTFTVCIVPFYYVAQYALGLMATDRYAMPVYPLVFAASLIVITRLRARLTHAIAVTGIESLTTF